MSVWWRWCCFVQRCWTGCSCLGWCSWEESTLRTFRDRRIRIMFVTVLASFTMEKAWKRDWWVMSVVWAGSGNLRTPTLNSAHISLPRRVWGHLLLTFRLLDITRVFGGCTNLYLPPPPSALWFDWCCCLDKVHYSLLCVSMMAHGMHCSCLLTRLMLSLVKNSNFPVLFALVNPTSFFFLLLPNYVAEVAQVARAADMLGFILWSQCELCKCSPVMSSFYPCTLQMSTSFLGLSFHSLIGALWLNFFLLWLALLYCI